MTSQSPRPAGPSLNLHGAVDLGALAARRQGTSQAGTAGAGAGAGAGSPGSFVIDSTDATFTADVVQISMTVPVVIDFWADWCTPCKQLSPVLESLAAEYGGRFLLAKVDADANPQLAEAFQVQGIPAVFAVLKGQPVPLFQGAQPEAQVRAVLEKLLEVAAANGVTGRVEGGSGDVAAAAEEPAEEPLPPLLQKAYDAIQRDDLDGAVAAYEQALRENPGDAEARLGLSQVRLLQRVRSVDQHVARANAAAAPADVDAQILVADLDVLGGHVADAFARLIDTVRITAGDDRDRVRAHLVELFDVVGVDDPRVAKARMGLASALF
jgi:putative thioredoxin